MKRRLGRVLLVLFAGSGIIFGVLWPGSYRVGFYLNFQGNDRQLCAWIEPGNLRLAIVDAVGAAPNSWKADPWLMAGSFSTEGWESVIDMTPIPDLPQFGGIRAGSYEISEWGRRYAHRELDIALWLIALASSLAAVVIAFRIPRRRREANCCTVCGYNLTANTSGVCPECGKPVAAIKG